MIWVVTDVMKSLQATGLLHSEFYRPKQSMQHVGFTNLYAAII